MIMNRNNKKSVAISVRMAPDIKDRISFECISSPQMNRNKFVNVACALLLDLRKQIRDGKLKFKDLPPVCQLWYNSMI